MIVFAVISIIPNPALDRAIAAKFPSNFLKLSDTNWLVAGSGTAKDVCDLLGIGKDGFGKTVVFSTAGYFGRAPTNIWEWINAKLEAS